MGISKKWRIPVTWEAFGYIEKEADTLEEAYEWVFANLDKLKIPEEQYTYEGSLEMAADCPEGCVPYN